MQMCLWFECNQFYNFQIIFIMRLTSSLVVKQTFDKKFSKRDNSYEHARKEQDLDFSMETDSQLELPLTTG